MADIQNLPTVTKPHGRLLVIERLSRDDVYRSYVAKYEQSGHILIVKRPVTSLALDPKVGEALTVMIDDIVESNTIDF